MRSRVVDEVDDVAGDVALGRAGDADRLVERDVDVPLLRAPTRSPSTRTSSPSFTCVPSAAGHAVDRDAALRDQASASRREQTPVSLMYLLSRTGRDCAERPLKSRRTTAVRLLS